MEHPKKVKIFAIITLTWFIFSSLATWVIVLLDSFSTDTQPTTSVETPQTLSWISLSWSTSSWNIADFSVEEISTWTTNK